MWLARPIHICATCRVLHEVFKGSAHIAGYVNCLYFTRAKIGDAAMLIIRDENDINVAGRLALPIFQTNFNQRNPGSIGWKEKCSGIVGNQPVFTEPYRAGNGGIVALMHATHAQRIVGLILRAVGDFVVKGTESFCPVAMRFR